MAALRPTLGVGLVLAALSVAGTRPAAIAVAASDTYCTGTYGAADMPRQAPLRFGIDPELAGSSGAVQTPAKPENDARRLEALSALRPSGRALVLRVNRLFWSDGEDGVRRFEAIVAHDTAAGFDVELQVRYHPSSAQDGDLAGWAAYVRHVVDVFGPNPHVVAMTITNEDNINVSPNTSDGSYQNATGALTAGVVAARQEADAHGWRRLTFGFTYAWRFSPQGDAAFWKGVAAGGPAFRQALGFVGVDLYPGSFYPPALPPGDDVRQEMIKGLATVRGCWMASAGLGAAVPIWITENGYPTTPGTHTEAEQAQALDAMVGAAHDYAGTYGVTDYRWFNLRDNDSSGTGMFDTDGVLRDDYSRKPSFAVLRGRIASDGAPAGVPALSGGGAGHAKPPLAHRRASGHGRRVRRRPASRHRRTVRAHRHAARPHRHADPDDL